MATGFKASRNLEPDSTGKVWLSGKPEDTNAVATLTGWMIEVVVPDEVAESWLYRIDGCWVGSYNPLVEDVNFYPRRDAYPWPRGTSQP